jgi:palmitoyltransferase
MKGEKFLSLPVLGVLSLMLFVYYTTIFIFLDEWLGLRTSPGTLNFFFFTLIASLSLFSFFLFSLTLVMSLLPFTLMLNHPQMPKM